MSVDVNVVGESLLVYAWLAGKEVDVLLLLALFVVFVDFVDVEDVVDFVVDVVVNVAVVPCCR